MKNCKTICFITNLSLNEEPTVENRLLPYISQSLKAGHKVILVSRDTKPISCITSFDFSHICCPEDVVRPISFVARARHENKGAKELLRFARVLSADIFVLTIPSMFLLFNANLLKGRQLILDVRDLTWHYLSKSSFLQRGVKLIFEFLACKNYKYFEQIAVTNQTEEEYFNTKSIDSILNYNGISHQQFKELSAIKPKPVGDKLIVSYVGKVGVAQNLNLVIDVARELPDVIFNIVGYGPQYNDFKLKVKTETITNIRVPGSATWDEVLAYYRDSDILYAQLSNEYSGAMPSKLYQYLCSSRFVVYGGSGQAKSILSLFSNNRVIQPDNPSELKKAIQEFKTKGAETTGFKRNLSILKSSYVRETNVDKVISKF